MLLGACLGPVAVTCFELVDRLAPAGTLVEGFTATTAAGLTGLALGITAAGALIDRAGPGPTFLAAAIVAAVSGLTALLRRNTLPSKPPQPSPDLGSTETGGSPSPRFDPPS